jgi:hypothetical protein
MYTNQSEQFRRLNDDPALAVLPDEDCILFFKVSDVNQARASSALDRTTVFREMIGANWGRVVSEVLFKDGIMPQLSKAPDRPGSLTELQVRRRKC